MIAPPARTRPTPLQPSPPSFLIPTSTPLSTDEVFLKGRIQHFITQKEFERWGKDHPTVRLRPEDGGYRAPQHPASHVFQSIPPRAPCRSTRSNILSYTLHLATTARLDLYTTSYASLLRTAEDADLIDSIEDSTLEADEKAAGLYKLSQNLLRSNRSADTGPLPVGVERRVSLAGLVEQVLATPAEGKAVKKVEEQQVRDSVRVEAIKALAPLTSPDTTVLYPSSVSTARATTSIAQSLIDMKFGSSAGEDTSAISSQFVDDDKPPPPPRSSTVPASSVPVSSDDSAPPAASSSSSIPDRSSETVFGTIAGHTSIRSSQLTAAPHMDYRIVRRQAMRSRAKDIFSESILPTSSTIWCRRHRVNSCTVCALSTTMDAEAGKKAGGRRSKREFAGQALGMGGDEGKSLAATVPDFIVFTSNLLKDARERAAGNDPAHMGYTLSSSAKDSSSINVTAAWYSLLHSFVTQACLEGYLVDGWVGTSGIEVLFGLGCGVWEGRGWSSRVAPSNGSVSSERPKKEDVEMDGESSESESEDEDEGESMREALSGTLIEAAQILFGSRDLAQADFEKSMRDRIHEFLNVQEGTTLTDHLVGLNAKYPLSSFEREMVDFLESTSRLLGQPALARMEASAIAKASTTTTAPINTGEPDHYAMVRYFATTDSPDVEFRGPHRPWEDIAGGLVQGKRRRVD